MSMCVYQINRIYIHIFDSILFIYYLFYYYFERISMSGRGAEGEGENFLN